MSTTNISEFMHIRNTMIVNAVDDYCDFLMALEKISPVQGTHRLYTAKELAIIADKIFAGNMSYECMTRTYGLRDKLDDLVNDFHIYCSWYEEE